jgi:hypothetical protein
MTEVAILALRSSNERTCHAHFDKPAYDVGISNGAE